MIWGSGDGRYVNIYVSGEGLLNVTLSVDGIVVDETQVEEMYEYCFEIDYEDHVIIVNATAQADGKTVSDVVTETFNIEAALIPLPPEITFIEDDSGVVITVAGFTTGLSLHVNVTINGETFSDSTGDQIYTFCVESSYDEDKYITVEACAVDPYGFTSETVVAEYVLYKRELQYLADPIIEIHEEEYCVVIYAYGAEGFEEIWLLINGEEVEIPYRCDRCAEEMYLIIEAIASAPYYNSSHTFMTYMVPPIPAPIEKTAAPTFSSYVNEYGYFFTIEPSEPSIIYYRIGFNLGDYEWSFTDFMEYEAQIFLSEQGHYRIEAYAVAEGKEPSDMVAYEVYVSPYPIYDFEEDGIFYKITGDGKVSVCTETTAYNSYSGHVTIPATVTHDGETYMVTAIDNNAFRDCSGLTGVTIGAYVTAIGDFAFAYCSGLTSVTLGDYVIKVGANAFYGCRNLTSVTLGSGVAQIGASAFYGCYDLASVTCKAATPPSLASSNCFSCYSTATLHVYPAVLDSYKTRYLWKQFTNIVGEASVVPAVGDANGDGTFSISDITTLINMLLRGY